MNQDLYVYCEAPDCKAESKIIKNQKDNLTNHGHHKPNYKYFDDIRRELQNPLHPLNKAKKNQANEEILELIDVEIEKLIKSFTAVAKDLQKQFKNFVSSNVEELDELFELFDAIIDRDEQNIEDLQLLIPNLSNSSKDIMNQDAQREIVRGEVVEVLKELNQKIQALKKIDFTAKVALTDYQWSTVYKHPNAKITGALITGQKGAWNMALMKPSLNILEVTKVRIRITKLFDLCISICDLNIAKAIRPIWDDRRSIGDGTYSHRGTGGMKNDDKNLGIHPHHLGNDQSNGFAFKEGDVLDLEWNGPLKQFTTSRPSTKEKYVQNVEFSENAELYFGVQMGGPITVEIIP